MGKDLEGNDLGKGFRQRADGRFEARVYVPGIKNPYCFYDRKLSSLKKKTREFKKRKAPLAERYNPRISVAVWYEEWMKLYVIPVNKNTTIQNYVNGFERMREYIGYVKLIDVTPSTISFVIDSLLKEGYARTTVLQSLSILRQLFQHAFNSGLVPTNPCDTVRFSKERPGEIPDDDKKCISPQDLERFLEVCRRRRYYELFLILFHTGMRIGEACALGWSDVDFENGLIYVRKTVGKVYIYYDESNQKLPQRQWKKQVTSPKKKASYRTIPMNAEVRQAFLDWKKKQDEDKKTYRKNWGKENPLADALPDPVFTTSPGNPYLPGPAYQETRRIIDIVNRKEEKLAMKEHRKPHLIYFSPHMLRHTFVTHCVESGMDYASIRKITGHADLKMTEYYTHLEQEHLKHSYQKYEEKYLLSYDKENSSTDKKTEV